MRPPDLRRGPIDLWRCEAARIEVGPSPAIPAEIARRTDERWHDLLAANDRLHDGPVLSADELDPGTGRIVAHPDTYARLAVRPEVDTGVVALAVGGVLSAVDEAGREHVLLIRRHEKTRLYPGMWEVGPAGGIDPAPGVGTLGFADLLAELPRELDEEAGLREPLTDARVALVYRDNHAHTIDVVIRATFGSTVERLRAVAGETEWDAAEARWVPLDDLADFIDSHATLEATIGQLEALALL